MKLLQNSKVNNEALQAILSEFDSVSVSVCGSWFEEYNSDVLFEELKNVKNVKLIANYGNGAQLVWDNSDDDRGCVVLGKDFIFEDGQYVYEV